MGGPGASDADAVYSELPHGAPRNGEYPVMASPADASDPELPSELIRPSCQQHTQHSRAGGNMASQHQLHLHLACCCQHVAAACACTRLQHTQTHELDKTAADV